MNDSVQVHIQVNGVDTPVTFSLYSITTQSEMNGYGKAVISYIADFIPSAENANEVVKFFNSGLPVTIGLGNSESTTVVFKGIITQQRLSASEENSLIEIICEDYSPVIASLVLPQKPDSRSVVSSLSSILRKNGFTLRIPTRIKKTIPETNSHHVWQLLQELAKLNEMNLSVNEKELLIAPADFNQNTVVSLTYGENILSIECGSALYFQTGKTAKRANQAGVSASPGLIHIEGNALVTPGKLIEVNTGISLFNNKAFITGTKHQVINGNWFTWITTGTGN